MLKGLDLRQRALKVFLEFRITFENPVKDPQISLSCPGDISKFFMFSSWGSLFYWALEAGVLPDIWLRPFSLLSLTTEWGDHDLWEIPKFFNQETFGFITLETEISETRAVKTIFDSGGVKEFLVRFFRWKKPKEENLAEYVKKLEGKGVLEEDITIIEVPFVPISQGLSTSYEEKGIVPSWKILAVERGYEEVLNRNPSSFSVGQLGEIFSKGSQKITQSSLDLSSPVKTGFFTSKHRVLEIIQAWIYNNSKENKDWIFGGKFGSLGKPWGKADYFSPNSPSFKTADLEGFFGTIEDIKGKLKEEDYYLTFIYLPAETRLVKKETLEPIEIYRRDRGEDMVSDLEKVSSDSEVFLRPWVKSFYLVPAFLFRTSKIFPFSEVPDKYYELVALRTDPNIAHFTGPGTPFYFHCPGFYKNIRRGIILSWAYSTFTVNQVFGDLELIGLFLD